MHSKYSVLRPRKDRGFALIAGLLLLVVMTIIGITMFRSFGLQEIMAGNLREKTRAFNAAQSALKYGEWWLTQGNDASQPGVACNSSLGVFAQVCSNPVAGGASPSALSWPSWVDYTPYWMTGMVSSSGGPDTYSKNPGLYIQFLGINSSNTLIYQVTAYGYGGNQNAVAVVQSTYGVSTGVQNLGGP